jgi:hypothetical protein
VAGRAEAHAPTRPGMLHLRMEEPPGPHPQIRKSYHRTICPPDGAVLLVYRAYGIGEIVI